MFSKTHVTFLLWLIIFEPIEQKQSYTPLLKVLMCGMNAWGAQWYGGIFILQYFSLKIVLLLHKTALVNFPMATTVVPDIFIARDIIPLNWELPYTHQQKQLSLLKIHLLDIGTRLKSKLLWLAQFKRFLIVIEVLCHLEFNISFTFKNLKVVPMEEWYMLWNW